MKSIIAVLSIIALSLFMIGCANNDINTQAEQQNIENTDSTIGLDEQPMSPDIGTLDDIPVSDEMPQ